MSNRHHILVVQVSFRKPATSNVTHLRKETRKDESCSLGHAVPYSRRELEEEATRKKGFWAGARTSTIGGHFLQYVLLDLFPCTLPVLHVVLHLVGRISVIISQDSFAANTSKTRGVKTISRHPTGSGLFRKATLHN